MVVQPSNSVVALDKWRLGVGMDTYEFGMLEGDQILLKLKFPIAAQSARLHTTELAR